MEALRVYVLTLKMMRVLMKLRPDGPRRRKGKTEMRSCKVVAPSVSVKDRTAVGLVEQV